MNAAAKTFRAFHGQVPAGGVLRSHAGINFPTYSLSKPALSDKDKPDFFFGVNQGVDLIALSCVRQVQDVAAARRNPASLVSDCGICATASPEIVVFLPQK